LNRDRRRTSADQNIETIQSIYEAFGLGDVEAILANVTDDVGWVSRPRHACVRQPLRHMVGFEPLRLHP
jgi:ketosteroid isomerase-like protein